MLRVSFYTVIEGKMHPSNNCSMVLKRLVGPFLTVNLTECVRMVMYRMTISYNNKSDKTL